jgi:hypothetical protein
MRKRSGCWLGLIAVVLLLLLWVRTCTSTDHTPTPRVDASASGLMRLFEAECFKWRSFRWAARNYLVDRGACRGEITRRSIEDCQANVVASGPWTVQTTDPRYTLQLEYVFGETATPTQSDAMCSLSVPDQLGELLSTTANAEATKHGLIGPLEPAESESPALKKFWVDSHGTPVLGIWFVPTDWVGDQERPSKRPWQLVRWAKGPPIETKRHP